VDQKDLLCALPPAHRGHHPHEQVRAEGGWERSIHQARLLDTGEFRDRLRGCFGGLARVGAVMGPRVGQDHAAVGKVEEFRGGAGHKPGRACIDVIPYLAFSPVVALRCISFAVEIRSLRHSIPWKRVRAVWNSGEEHGEGEPLDGQGHSFHRRVRIPTGSRSRSSVRGLWWCRAGCRATGCGKVLPLLRVAESGEAILGLRKEGVPE
jgi:hypothetical protein